MVCLCRYCTQRCLASCCVKRATTAELIAQVTRTKKMTMITTGRRAAELRNIRFRVQGTHVTAGALATSSGAAARWPKLQRVRLRVQGMYHSWRPCGAKRRCSAAASPSIMAAAAAARLCSAVAPGPAAQVTIMCVHTHSGGQQAT